jgi:NifU-like protein involved in Fe-S cluster formation
LGLLQPVKDYPHRHASTLLVFDAVEQALNEIAGKRGAGVRAAS